MAVFSRLKQGGTPPAKGKTPSRRLPARAKGEKQHRKM
jgi:hypothetical protein